MWTRKRDEAFLSHKIWFHVYFVQFQFRYVIKAVVYEIGILTEADDNATLSDENVT